MGSIPVIGDDLQVGTTKGSGLALVVGLSSAPCGPHSRR